MSEDSPNIKSDFLMEVERLVTPAYLECFSDETRKVRNLLLLTSLALILFTLGIIESPDFKLPMPSMSFMVTTGMRWVIMLLCAYFLILHVMRSYTEWKLWLLRQQAPLIEFSKLADKISSLVQTHSDEAVPEIKDLKAQLDYLKEVIRPAGKILRIRFWWETLFPSAFGVIAILIGLFWPQSAAHTSTAAQMMR